MNKFLHFNVNIGPDHRKAFKKKWQSRTVATEPLSGDKILALAEAYLSKSVNDELFAYVGVGITFLSLKDRYNKQTGRDEALKKLKLEKLLVQSVEVTNTHIFVRLAPFQGVQLNLRTSKVSGFSTITGELLGS